MNAPANAIHPDKTSNPYSIGFGINRGFTGTSVSNFSIRQIPLEKVKYAILESGARNVPGEAYPDFPTTTQVVGEMLFLGREGEDNAHQSDDPGCLTTHRFLRSEARPLHPTHLDLGRWDFKCSLEGTSYHAITIELWEPLTQQELEAIYIEPTDTPYS